MSDLDVHRSCCKNQAAAARLPLVDRRQAPTRARITSFPQVKQSGVSTQRLVAPFEGSKAARCFTYTTAYLRSGRDIGGTAGAQRNS
jgi:hypothetical protein